VRRASVRNLFTASVTALVAVGTTTVATAPGALAATAYENATNYQNNAAHTGLTAGPALPTTMKRLWSKDFGAALSYPLIVGNRVFVTAVPKSGATSPQVFAFDKRTGRSLWTSAPLGGYYATSSLAYGNGRLIALNSDGKLRSFSPATGHVFWSATLADPSYPGTRMNADKPVTVRAGVAYVIDSWVGDNYGAYDVVTGKRKWAKWEQLGALGAAVDSTRVHLVSDCEQDSYTPAGVLVWAHNQRCQGGVAGTSAVLAGGQLWARTSNSTNLILDAKTGTIVSRFNSLSAPAVVGDRAFLTQAPTALYDVTFQAVNRTTGAVLWSRKPTPDTYGQIIGVPIATKSVVYLTMSGGSVRGYSTSSGKLVWSGNTGTTYDTSNGGESGQIKGSAIGGGVLAVQLGKRLTVFG
jgi:outer membrane protein assembly factor BamB